MAPKKTSVFNRSASTFLIILLTLSASPVSADDEVKWLKVPIPSEGKGGGWLLAPGSDIEHPAYYWKVRALGVRTASDWSAASAFTTQREPAPSRPCNFRLLMPTQSPTPQILVIPAPTPLPPAPAPQPPVVPDAPQWMIYLIGGLLLTNILLIITVLALVKTIRRL